MEKIIIVGAGVAGLSCLNACLDRGVFPLLIDASEIGTPKICGEFLAPAAAHQLKQWNITPLVAVEQIQFYANHSCLTVKLRQSAVGLARREAEIALASRAREHGGRIREHTRIQTLIPATQNTPYQLHLDSGEIFLAEHIVVATGKWTMMQQQSRYVGFKTHLKGMIHPKTLLMFSLVDAYLGIVPIDDHTSNLTCLVQKDRLSACKNPNEFLKQVMQSVPALRSCLADIDVNELTLLTGDAPAFGLKSLPSWPRALWIGDAFASLYPSIGYGFAHSIQSAIYAAECYIQQDIARYHDHMRRQLYGKWLMSRGMHKLLQSPRACRFISPVLNTNPWLLQGLL